MAGKSGSRRTGDGEKKRDMHWKAFEISDHFEVRHMGIRAVTTENRPQVVIAVCLSFIWSRNCTQGVFIWLYGDNMASIGGGLGCFGELNKRIVGWKMGNKA